MITKQQAQEYLSSQGLELPPFVIDLVIGQIATIDGCLDANYTPMTADFIRLHLLTLLSISQTNMYISSKKAPSGAAVSMQFQPVAERWRSAAALLRQLDTKGCATSLVPPEPTNGFYGGLWSVRAGSMCE